jgi:hypothetical protein
VVHALDVVAETSGYANVIEMSGAISGMSGNDVAIRRKSAQPGRNIRWTFHALKIFVRKSFRTHFLSGLPDFSWYNIPKTGKNTTFTKCPLPKM